MGISNNEFLIIEKEVNISILIKMINEDLDIFKTTNKVSYIDCALDHIQSILILNKDIASLRGV